MAEEHAAGASGAGGEGLVIAHVRSVVVLLVLGLLSLLAPMGVGFAAGAPVISVSAQAPASAYVGDLIPFTIQVENSRDVEAPDLSGLKDFTAAYRGPQDASSTFTQIVNGRVSTQQTIRYGLSYTLTPRKTGTLTIPPIAVTVAGKTYTTQALTITIGEPARTIEHTLEYTAEAKTAFVGQPIRLTFTWTVGQDFRGYSITTPTGTDEYDIQPGPNPRPPNTDSNDRRFPDVLVNGQRVTAIRAQTTHNNAPALAITFDQILIPRKPGMIRLAGARIDVDTVVGQKQRGFFDSVFDDSAIVERRYTTSEPFTIAVSALPTEGRPADFSGLVGSYGVRLSASPQDAAVGDPIRLQIIVSGPAPTSLIPPLDLTRQPGFASGWRVPRDPLLPELGPTEAVFGTDVRARTDKVSEVPPVELNYFDPKTKRYEIARSQPIPLKIRPSTQVTLGTSDEGRAEDPKEIHNPPDGIGVPPSRPGGLAPIDRSPLGARSAPGSYVEVFTSPWAIAGVGIPSALYAASLIVVGNRRRRERAPAHARRARALRRAERALARAASDPETVSGVLLRCVAECFARDPGTLTSAEAVDLTTRSTGKPADRLRSVLAECDAAIYGVSPADRATLGVRSLDAIEDLRPLGLRGPS